MNLGGAVRDIEGFDGPFLSKKRMMLTEQWKDTYDNAFYKVSVRCSSSAVQ